MLRHPCCRRGPPLPRRASSWNAAGIVGPRSLRPARPRSVAGVSSPSSLEVAARNDQRGDCHKPGVCFAHQSLAEHEGIGSAENAGNRLGIGKLKGRAEKARSPRTPAPDPDRVHDLFCGSDSIRIMIRKGEGARGDFHSRTHAILVSNPPREIPRPILRRCRPAPLAAPGEARSSPQSMSRRSSTRPPPAPFSFRPTA